MRKTKITYEQIKDTILTDYENIAQVRVVKGGRSTMKTFYLNFSRALEELYTAVGPFITTTEQFVEHIKYLKSNIPNEIYEIIIQYCKDKFKLTIE